MKGVWAKGTTLCPRHDSEALIDLGGPRCRGVTSPAPPLQAAS